MQLYVSMVSIQEPSFETSENRLQVVLNAIPVAVSWANLEDGHIVFMNRTFTDMFGYTISDFATVNEWVERAYPLAEHQERARKSWFRFFGNPTKDEFEIEPVEVDVLCKNGIVKTTIHGGIILPAVGWALATFVDISERKKNETLIKTLAQEDPLTGLLNRRSLNAHLSRAIRSAHRDNQTLHLLMMDLDRFKQVNDRLGHQAGDHVLKETANRLKKCIRSGDILARYGGDEFVAVLPNSGSRVDIDRICAKIVEAINQPVTFEDHCASVGVSIGISHYPHDAEQMEQLVVAADKAMYNSKETGRGTWTHYGMIDPMNDESSAQTSE